MNLGYTRDRLTDRVISTNLKSETFIEEKMLTAIVEAILYSDSVVMIRQKGKKPLYFSFSSEDDNDSEQQKTN